MKEMTGLPTIVPYGGFQWRHGDRVVELYPYTVARLAGDCYIPAQPVHLFWGYAENATCVDNPTQDQVVAALKWLYEMTYSDGEDVKVGDWVRVDDSLWRVIRVEEACVHVSGPGPCRSIAVFLPSELTLEKRG